LIGSGAASASVILVDPAKPRKLFDAFSVVLGERIPEPKNRQVNTSYAFMKTAWLEVVNRYAGVKPFEARAAVDAAFSAATHELDRLSTVPFPALPAAFDKYLEGVWQLQLEYLKTLQQIGRVRLL
jgi:hypothetical protein